MDLVVFYLLRIFLGAIRLLPFSILYILSFSLRFFLQYILRYRRKIIIKNLTLSFPSATKEFIKKNKNNFYQYLADMFLESLKCFTMTLPAIQQKISVHNEAILKKLYDQKKNVVVVLGHYGNFEYLCRALPYLNYKYKVYGLYQPLKNKLIDEFILKNRSRFGNEMISVRDMRKLIGIQKSDIPVISYFAMDQVPGAPHQSALWMDFLHQDTPVITGAEKYARQFDQAVVYLEMKRPSRGVYELHFQLITSSAASEPENSITIKQMNLLEDTIKSEPAFWLWSHNRWKHKRLKS
jgi:Kdo2-lipid IVA lauroyltransferase/acyltransferase